MKKSIPNYIKIVKFCILYFVLFNPNFGVLFDRTGVCNSTVNGMWSPFFRGTFHLPFKAIVHDLTRICLLLNHGIISEECILRRFALKELRNRQNPQAVASGVAATRPK